MFEEKVGNSWESEIADKLPSLREIVSWRLDYHFFKYSLIAVDTRRLRNRRGDDPFKFPLQAS